MSVSKEIFPNVPEHIRPKLNAIVENLERAPNGTGLAASLRRVTTILFELVDPIKRAEYEQRWRQEQDQAAELIGQDNVDLLLRGFMSDSDPDTFDAT